MPIHEQSESIKFTLLSGQPTKVLPIKVQTSNITEMGKCSTHQFKL